jgi:YidC/Oxa1 family membrane protein insertase
MSYLFNNLFYKPLLNALGALTMLMPGNSFGASVIVLTIIVNLILLPFTHKAKHSQQKIRDIQPELDRIKLQYKDKKEEQARKTLELYREHGINPFSGMAMLIVQIPLFFALFSILRNSSSDHGANIYSFLPPLPPFNPTFLGFIDLTAPYIPFAVAAAILQFIQGLLMAPAGPKPKKDDFSYILQQQFKYIIPVVIFWMGLQFPSALTLYLITMSGFAIVHEVVVRRRARALTTSNGNNSTKTTKQ